MRVCHMTAFESLPAKLVRISSMSMGIGWKSKWYNDLPIILVKSRHSDQIFTPRSFRFKNSTKDLKLRLPFADICVGSGDIKFEKYVKYANESASFKAQVQIPGWDSLLCQSHSFFETPCCKVNF